MCPNRIGRSGLGVNLHVHEPAEKLSTDVFVSDADPSSVRHFPASTHLEARGQY